MKKRAKQPYEKQNRTFLEVPVSSSLADYLEVSLRSRKVPYLTYDFDNLDEFFDEQKIEHKIVVLDQSWDTNEIQEWSSRCFFSETGQTIDYIHFFKLLKDGIFSRTTLSKHRVLQGMIDSAIRWLLSERVGKKSPLWHDSFWTTVDVVNTIEACSPGIEFGSDAILETVKKNVTNGAYDQSFAPTCGLLLLQFHLKHANSEDFENTKKWLSRNYNQYSLDEKALYDSTLKLVGQTVPVKLINGIERSVTRNEFTRTPLSMNRVLYALTLCDRFSETSKLVEALIDKFHTDKDGWENTIVKAGITSTLIEFQRRNETKSKKIDTQIFIAIQAIVSEFVDGSGSFSEDSLTTAACAKAINDFVVQYEFSIDDFIRDIDSEVLSSVSEDRTELGTETIGRLLNTIDDLTSDLAAKKTELKTYNNEHNLIILRKNKWIAFFLAIFITLISSGLVGVIYLSSIWSTQGQANTPQSINIFLGWSSVLSIVVPIAIVSMIGVYTWWLKRVGLVGKKSSE